MVDEPAHVDRGDVAPDVWLKDEMGAEVQLASCWRERRVILVFARHFG